MGWLNSFMEEMVHLKIPNTIRNVNSQNVFVGDNHITETFWYIGDTNWDSIMVNPGYFDNTTTLNH